MHWHDVVLSVCEAAGFDVPSPKPSSIQPKPQTQTKANMLTPPQPMTGFARSDAKYGFGVLYRVITLLCDHLRLLCSAHDFGALLRCLTA